MISWSSQLLYDVSEVGLFSRHNTSVGHVPTEFEVVKNKTVKSYIDRF